MVSAYTVLSTRIRYTRNVSAVPGPSSQVGARLEQRCAPQKSDPSGEHRTRHDGATTVRSQTPVAAPRRSPRHPYLRSPSPLHTGGCSAAYCSFAHGHAPRDINSPSYTHRFWFRCPSTDRPAREPIRRAPAGARFSIPGLEAAARSRGARRFRPLPPLATPTSIC